MQFGRYGANDRHICTVYLSELPELNDVFGRINPAGEHCAA